MNKYQPIFSLSPAQFIRRIIKDPHNVRKKSAQYLSFNLARLGAHNRTLPDYIIIGAMKAGTSSLHKYLSLRTATAAPLTKEVHYFDNNYRKGKNWYKAHFPKKIDTADQPITGEASPYYMFHPLAPERIKKMLPDVKLIAMLRNPVDRAYSHYQHNCRIGCETESFEKALELEPARLKNEKEKMLANPSYYSFAHQTFAYTERGNYADQIESWLKHFRRDQLLIIKSEDFFDAPAEITNQAAEFLAMPPCQKNIEYKRYNYHGQYEDMPQQARQKLTEHFTPQNKKLNQLPNININW